MPKLKKVERLIEECDECPLRGGYCIYYNKVIPTTGKKKPSWCDVFKVIIIEKID